jgi:hypothetical protein
MIDINDRGKINGIGWLLKVRRGGEILEINREYKREGDIYIGNVFSDYKNKKIDANKIKICRGGNTVTINSKDMLPEDHIEYKYLKWEVKEENGKCIECTEQEKKDYIIENLIKPKLIEKYKNTEKVITDPEGKAEDYNNELTIIETLSYEEIKKYKII